MKANQKEGYLIWSAQPMKRHNIVSLKCKQRELQVRPMMHNEEQQNYPKVGKVRRTPWSSFPYNLIDSLGASYLGVH